MRDALVLDLADCTEFRQVLQTRPPGVVHGTILLLAVLLGAALGWSALTRANLVVRASGRVRPVATPVKVTVSARGDVLGAGVGVRVVEVNFREGDHVARGDVLLRLGAERIVNEIFKQERTIRAGEAELASLVRIEGLLTHQYAAGRAKAEAELAQARAAVSLSKERRKAEVRLAELELEAARREEAQTRALGKRGAVSPADLAKAITRAHEAGQKLEKARLPVEGGNIRVLEQALELVGRDYTVKREELEMKRGVRRAEFEAARADLVNRELERKQSVILAPIDGIVTFGDLKVGDVLEAGKSVIEIAQETGFRFEVKVPSEGFGHLRLGMPARIKLDAYDYQRYGTLTGTVVHISPDSGVDQDGKVTHAVKIAVHREEVGRGAFRGRVKLGMGGQAEVVTGRESLLSILVKKIRRSISLG